mmetsp:Transcript_50608/g.128767  ORF Transcript_50608/g.128767 Transcript_50608/m.128767 type:complete len:231 (-) Transcript_50608:113-805(-)
MKTHCPAPRSPTGPSRRATCPSHCQDTAHGASSHGCPEAVPAGACPAPQSMVCTLLRAPPDPRRPNPAQIAATLSGLSRRCATQHGVPMELCTPPSLLVRRVAPHIHLAWAIAVRSGHSSRCQNSWCRPTAAHSPPKALCPQEPDCCTSPGIGPLPASRHRGIPSMNSKPRRSALSHRSPLRQLLEAAAPAPPAAPPSPPAARPPRSPRPPRSAASCGRRARLLRSWRGS